MEHRVYGCFIAGEEGGGGAVPMKQGFYCPH